MKLYAFEIYNEITNNKEVINFKFAQIHFKKVVLGFPLTVDETLFGAEGPLFLNHAVW